MVYSCIGVDATFVIYQCNYNEEPEISRTVYKIDLHSQELFTQINQISASMLMPPKGTVTGCNFVACNKVAPCDGSTACNIIVCNSVSSKLHI